MQIIREDCGSKPIWVTHAGRGWSARCPSHRGSFRRLRKATSGPEDGSATMRWQANWPRKGTLEAITCYHTSRESAMGQAMPPPPQVVVVRQGHSGCFWFLIFLLIAVLVVGIVVFLAAMGLFGAIAGLFA
jgi:hypothetical protein